MAETTLAPVACALTARADRPGIFSGYASLFGTTDSQGDLVETGAFRPSLETWRSRGRRPAMLWQHDPTEPIGLWTHLEEDAIGLRVEGRLLLSVRSGAEAYEHIKAGTVTGLSIGYQAVEALRDRKTGVRRLLRVNLWEISLVTFPANNEARIATVKADEDLPDARARLTRALRRVILTRPIVPFPGSAAERKNSVDYRRLHGRPQPRDDVGRFGNGAGARVALLANRGAAARVERRPTVPDPTRDARRAVDWGYIGFLEGGRQLDGKVPAAGRSGVTVATGVDLGQRSMAEIDKLNIDPTLKEAIKEKVRPFLGLTRAAASAKLKSQETRLALSMEEAKALDEAVRQDIYEKVSRRFDADKQPRVPRFQDLPAEAQTTILSVAYNAGPNFMTKAGVFWAHVTNADWPKAVHELHHWSKDPKAPKWLLDRRRSDALPLEEMLKRRSQRRR